MKRWIAILALIGAGCGRHTPPHAMNDGPISPAPVREDVPATARREPAEAPKLAAVHEEPAGREPEAPKVPRAIEVVIAETNASLQDAYFSYDRSELSTEALDALRHDAGLLASVFAEFPTVKAVVEGHCDERGSAEYNLALGDRRAMHAMDILRQLGIPAGRVRAISYGKEEPQCTQAGESCWWRNRRAHVKVEQ